MNKGLITLCAGIGGVIGGYIPVLLGSGSFSGWGIVSAFIGGLVGIWIGYKISNY